MLDGLKVTYKQGYKYYTGHVVKGKVKKIKQYKSLGDIPKFDKYVTFRKFLQVHKIKGVDVKEYMDGLDVSTLYILDYSEKIKNVVDVKNAVDLNASELSPKQWEKRWWKVKNQVCLDCVKKCKQSVYVTIVNCNKYKKVV